MRLINVGCVLFVFGATHRNLIAKVSGSSSIEPSEAPLVVQFRNIYHIAKTFQSGSPSISPSYDTNIQTSSVQAYSSIYFFKSQPGISAPPTSFPKISTSFSPTITMSKTTTGIPTQYLSSSPSSPKILSPPKSSVPSFVISCIPSKINMNTPAPTFKSFFPSSLAPLPAPSRVLSSIPTSKTYYTSTSPKISTTATPSSSTKSFLPSSQSTSIPPTKAPLKSNPPTAYKSLMPSPYPTLIPSKSSIAPSSSAKKSVSSIVTFSGLHNQLSSITTALSPTPTLLPSSSQGPSSSPQTNTIAPSADMQTAPPSSLTPSSHHPTFLATRKPTTLRPSPTPSVRPSRTHRPSTFRPSRLPLLPGPTYLPTPSVGPTEEPSAEPVFPTEEPTWMPTVLPSVPIAPSIAPSIAPTNAPSTNIPSAILSTCPSVASTSRPTFLVTSAPSSASPSKVPSLSPSTSPSTMHSTTPSWTPSSAPSTLRTTAPSAAPSTAPTILPSFVPSTIPSTVLSKVPSATPSRSPTNGPSIIPSAVPSMMPCNTPSKIPSQTTTWTPSTEPSAISTLGPSKSMSTTPTSSPSAVPSGIPSSLNPTGPSASPTTYNLYFNESYHGGPVMTGTVNLYNIYFGNLGCVKGNKISNLDFCYYVDTFAKYIGTSNWYKILSSYYQIQNGQRQNASSLAVFNMSIWISPNAVRMQISDVIIQNQIKNLISAKNLSLDPQGIYSVIFRGDFTFLDQYKDGWTRNIWCAYHGAFMMNGVLLKYSVMGSPTWSDNGANRFCIPPNFSGSSPSGNLGSSSVITTYAHELAEIVTDFDSTAWFNDFWALEGEIGDLCLGKYGHNVGLFNMQLGPKKAPIPYLVQLLWQNGFGCVSSLHTGSPLQRSTSPPSASPVLLPTAAPNLAFDLTYHGDVSSISVHTAKIFNIFFGNFSGTTISLMNYFAQNIGNTKWYNILTAYYKVAEEGSHGQEDPLNVDNTTALAGNYSFLLPKGANRTLTDVDIEILIARLFMEYNSSIYFDPNGVYMVMFPGYLNVSFQGKYWLRDWCSFHGAFVLGSGDTIKYSVVGDPSSAPGRSGQVCIPLGDNPTANGDPSADNMAVGYAQQLANIVTDGAFGGWFSDKNGLEAGSSCASNFSVDISKVNANVLVGERNFLMSSLWQPLLGCTLFKL